MINTKLQGDIKCDMCKKEMFWQDGLNDCRAVVIPGTKDTEGNFELKVEVRCPECHYITEHIIKHHDPLSLRD